MRSIISKVGPIGVSFIVTLVSIIMSVLITFSVLVLTHASEEIYRISLIISILCPAIIAPLVTWYLVTLLVKIHHLEAQQRKLATYDELTELRNRRSFFEHFEALKKISERQGKPLTLAYIDIDDFKPINDKFGHVVGDKVLKSFAYMLKESSRDSDIIARIGGEEFAILLPDTDLAGAHTILDRIREAVSSKPFIIEGHSIRLSISVGLSHYQNESELIIDQLLTQADKALYQAKSEGKNCIVQYA